MNHRAETRKNMRQARPLANPSRPCMQSCARFLCQYALRPSLRSAAAAARCAQQPFSSSFSTMSASAAPDAGAALPQQQQQRPEDVEDSRRPAPSEPLLSIAPM